MEFREEYAGRTVVVRQVDCVAGMATLERGSIELIVTSPPYNLGIAYDTYDDTLPRAQYLEWTREWARAARQALSEDGSLVLNVGGKPSDPYVPFDVAFCFRDEGFHLQNVIHWVKAISIEERIEQDKRRRVISRGHYRPVNSRRYLNSCHEYLFHYTKHGNVELNRLAVGVPYTDKSNVDRWESGKLDLRCRGNTWFIPYDTIQNRSTDRPHPASFPVRLPEMCAELHGLDRIRTVMDPFLGIGSTALAAVRLGKSFVGFEIDEGYFSTATSRIGAEMGKQTTKRHY
jgi:site-specific DNA-methyltransferase (adenine-specific)